MKNEPNKKRSSGSAGDLIGFVGLGKMGLPMARRIIEGGHAVIAFDVSSAALDEAAGFGAQRAGSPAEVAARCGRVVITMLPNIEVVRSVVLSFDGIASRLPAGSLLIDMSSSSPQGTVELGETLRKRGIELIDAPVSGGVPKAKTGELAIMVGGAPESVERALPILETMGKRIYQTGALGTAQAMKALNNLVSAAGMIAAMEALLVGKRFGLDPALMVDILNNSTGRNNTTENKLKQFVLSGSYGSGFGLDLQLKDVRTALELARQLGLELPVGAPTVAAVAAAAEYLGPGADHTAVAKHLEHKLGVSL
jgi:3-hydroxyisobutyrate dehydrogenase